MAHTCTSKIIIIGSDKGLSPDRHQAIIWINARLPLGINFSEISIEINKYSFKKMQKMSSAKRRQFWLGLSVLIIVPRLRSEYTDSNFRYNLLAGYVPDLIQTCFYSPNGLEFLIYRQIVSSLHYIISQANTESNIEIRHNRRPSAGFRNKAIQWDINRYNILKQVSKECLYERLMGNILLTINILITA